MVHIYLFIKITILSKSMRPYFVRNYTSKLFPRRNPNPSFIGLSGQHPRYRGCGNVRFFGYVFQRSTHYYSFIITLSFKQWIILNLYCKVRLYFSHKQINFQKKSNDFNKKRKYTIR
jgi:hypothetical protein